MLVWGRCSEGVMLFALVAFVVALGVHRDQIGFARHHFRSQNVLDLSRVDGWICVKNEPKAMPDLS